MISIYEANREDNELLNDYSYYLKGAQRGCLWPRSTDIMRRHIRLNRYTVFIKPDVTVHENKLMLQSIRDGDYKHV